MTETTLTAADYALAEDMFREAISNNASGEENLADIKTNFTELALGSWRNGTILVQVEPLLVDHLWARVNARAGRTTTQMLREIDTGQLSMAYDEWLDQPITVGKHRRTTIRHLDRQDLLRILEERQQNLNQANAAYQTAERAVAILSGVLDDYPSIADGLNGGAFEMHVKESA